MNVTESSPDRLVLEKVPTGLVVLDLGMCIAGALGAIAGGAVGEGEWVMGGLIVLAVFAVALIRHARRTLVVFDARAGEVRLLRRDLFGTSEERHPLAKIEGVAFEEIRSSRTGSRFRAALRISGRPGTVPLTITYQKRDHAEAGRFAVEDWLRAHGPRRSA